MLDVTETQISHAETQHDHANNNDNIKLVISNAVVAVFDHVDHVHFVFAA